ncbi:lipopolysaccharide transport periplasmic protein LptA [uncultured Pseudoteredinibacter sp.]|uniref:lipopolysaccharide transport periplasmic protein LptA n=1 Tax=uncultured Pseudoteredinibacter sp. TaxID=1641701 RepID=UPI002637669D|nr:lipopolysaccharide transport periplasmic protein LptA [uncultured Pseudoteredinibacter sp.]
MNLNSKLSKILLAASLGMGFAFGAMALPEDARQPIYVDADKAEIDKSTGVTIYKGNVIINQGSMKILADQVTIFNQEKKVSRIVAKGNKGQAQYQQKPNSEKDLVIAKADTIEYLVGKETLHLLDNAYLLQDGATVKGHRIDYDVRASMATATGQGDKGEKANSRIQVVIPAKQLNREDK